MSTAKGSTASKKYTVHNAANDVIAAFARKERAIDEYQTNKDAQYVKSPAGHVVHGSIAQQEEEKMTDTTTTEAEGTEKVKKARKPKVRVEGGCSLRRLTARATKNGLEVCNTGRIEGKGFGVSVVNLATGAQVDFDAAEARLAYGVALDYVKAFEAEEKAKAAAANAANAAA